MGKSRGPGSGKTPRTMNFERVRGGTRSTEICRVTEGRGRRASQIDVARCPIPPLIPFRGVVKGRAKGRRGN